MSAILDRIHRGEWDSFGRAWMVIGLAATCQHNLMCLVEAQDRVVRLEAAKDIGGMIAMASIAAGLP